MFRLARRYLIRRPLQSLLVVLGIALGVAVIVAIDLANGSASRAFELSTDAVAGRATHQIVGGPTGLPPSLYVELRRELALREVAPVVSEYVAIDELGNRPIRLLGIDPFSEAPFRSYLGSSEGGDLSLDSLTTFLTEPGAIFLSRAVAEQNGLAIGDRLTMTISGRTEEVALAGLLDPSDELSRRALDSLALADIATAQELLRTDRLTTIDLILDDSQVAAVEAVLPQGARLQTPAARSNTIAQLSSAFALNLTALSLLALVVGIFLIYNTVTFSVVQRRPLFGTLRALGVTRRELFGMILLEALLLGMVGSALGLLLGAFLGRGAVRLVTQTINDLYFVVNVEGVELLPAALLKGALIGMVAALLAAMPPAWEASVVPPALALRRSEIEQRAAALVRPLAGVGLALLLFGAVALWWPTPSIVVAFVGLFAIVIGAALLTPLVTVGAMRLFAPLLAPLGLLGRLAPRDIVRSLSRTSVAIAALMVAVSVIIGVGVMIGSFRNTVTTWLATTLRADIYITVPSLSATRLESNLPPDIAVQLAALEGVAAVTSSRESVARSPQLGQIRLVAVTDDVSQGGRQFKWREGSEADAWARLQAGEGLFISESFAFRHGLTRADSLTLESPQGERTFPLLGEFYDYSSDQGIVLMGYDAYRQLYDDPWLTATAAFVEPNVDVDALVAEARQRIQSEELLLIQSNAGLRDGALAVFDRTFAITGALRLLATIVAFIGVLAALMALQLERARTLGTLRALGMTQRQLWQVTMLETGLMGLTAGLWAMPVGLMLALVLIYVINRRSFGWTLQLSLSPEQFYQALLVAVVAALLAGLYPAWRLAQMRVSQAIRSE
ncbi:MAG: ABC transporter permease [Anaerolineales bacterium]|nr:ABC transporter permease [Anaerolineales bacterium]MCB9127393.1 ABC transporter permease [Ardenticatenales bacterium]